MVFHRHWKLALLLCLLLKYASASSTSDPRISPYSDPDHNEATRVCVVIRTFWGHGDGLLQDLLRSLQRQKYARWEALLVVMDSKPFSQLPMILAKIGDERVWVFAELIGTEYTPKHEGSWVPGFHGHLYNLTDQAMRACPPSTEWVLATNGDNLYADTFFDRVMTAPQEADAIAFDFYSRYQRMTAPPCSRFQRSDGLPACKSNRMRWCHTDLGANVFRWPRLVKEDRRLGSPAANAQEHQAEHFDGLFADSIKSDGWNVHHVTDACLFDHNPSPQRCGQMGGVWDDTRAVSTELGGTCLTHEEAQAHLQVGNGAMEVVDIELSHNGNVPSFFEESSNATTSLRCMRWADTTSQHQAFMVFYGSTCADDADLPELKAYLSSSSSAEQRQQVLQRVQLQSMQQRPTPWQKAPMLDRRPPKPPSRDVAGSAKQRSRLPQLDMSVKEILVDL